MKRSHALRDSKLSYLGIRSLDHDYGHDHEPVTATKWEKSREKQIIFRRLMGRILHTAEEPRETHMMLGGEKGRE